MNVVEALQQLREGSCLNSLRARYLVGVSGGCDSVVLCHLLAEAGYRHLVLCHLNHGLRGRESGGDARSVRALGKELGFEVAATKVDVREQAHREKISLELAGRMARHQFFAEQARQYRTRRLILAHHGDDQVETVLMRVLRGTSPAGLAGMERESMMAVGRLRLKIFRPLLGFFRSDLENLARGEGWRFREDSSNADPAFARNRIRRELIPLASAIFRREVRGSLWRLAELARAENAFWDERVGESAAQESLSLAALAQRGEAEQRRLLWRWLQCREVSQIRFALVEEIRALVENPERRVVNLPGARRLIKKRGVLVVESLG